MIIQIRLKGLTQNGTIKQIGTKIIYFCNSDTMIKRKTYKIYHTTRTEKNVRKMIIQRRLNGTVQKCYLFIVLSLLLYFVNQNLLICFVVLSIFDALAGCHDVRRLFRTFHELGFQNIKDIQERFSPYASEEVSLELLRKYIDVFRVLSVSINSD